ncbi:hypothetical protein [Prosthecobacter dejongeii]|uniref:Uncharacterized protein n=1 Tax=Prosthecobacter dejongeii TaxID=48465 RepID=A0A7W7YJ96_9BACT|nr:hypothetical protein [Prosthecobacter dejongeii]MBB5037102.1 hypothetical protein [Prosthecobacter dejongeii]
MSDLARAEDCRFLTRKVLYSRPTAALPVEAIVHQSNRLGGDYTAQEIQAAAEFLAGLEPSQVKQTKATLGSTLYFQITSAGILAYERNE